MNKTFLIPFGLAILLNIAALLVEEFNLSPIFSEKFTLFSVLLINIIGIAILYNNSDISRNWIFLFLIFAFLLLIVAKLFMIMRWPNQIEIVLISMVLVLFSYPIRLFKKKKKKSSDYLKLLWLISPHCILLYTLTFKIYTNEIYYIPSLLLIFMIGGMIKEDNTINRTV